MPEYPFPFLFIQERRKGRFLAQRFSGLARLGHHAQQRGVVAHEQLLPAVVVRTAAGIRAAQLVQSLKRSFLEFGVFQKAHGDGAMQRLASQRGNANAITREQIAGCACGPALHDLSAGTEIRQPPRQGRLADLQAQAGVDFPGGEPVGIGCKERQEPGFEGAGFHLDCSFSSILELIVNRYSHRRQAVKV